MIEAVVAWRGHTRSGAGLQLDQLDETRLSRMAGLWCVCGWSAPVGEDGQEVLMRHDEALLVPQRQQRCRARGLLQHGDMDVGRRVNTLPLHTVDGSARRIVGFADSTYTPDNKAVQSFGRMSTI